MVLLTQPTFKTSWTQKADMLGENNQAVISCPRFTLGVVLNTPTIKPIDQLD